MKVLFVSNLFPNRHEPARGVFNYHQVRHLAKHCEVRVVAPIAWFFVKGRYAPPAPVPAAEEIGGLQVFHPRNFNLPKLARTLNPMFYALSTRTLIARLRRDFQFDVILVNWAYPDACGMAKVARWLGVPFVASISGSDVNWYLRMRIRRRQILRMLEQARAVTVRSRALKALLVEHGVPNGKIHTLYNGVDGGLFAPVQREDARRRLSLNTNERILLYAGRLSPEKGVADLLEAMAVLRDDRGMTVRLVAVGDGHQRAVLQKKAEELKLADSVTWAGLKRPEEIAAFMGAADLLCVPSHSEGVPNAALEAFACGLPVVATSVGGIPEVMTDRTGILAPPRDPPRFAAAIAEALARPWDSAAIRAHATRFDWTENAKQLFDILRDAVKS